MTEPTFTSTAEHQPAFARELDIGHAGTPLSYADEKFSVAVRTLAISEEPMRQRIRDAYRSFTAVGPEDFPEGSSVRADYVALMARMTWAEDKTGQGTIPATLAVISDDECRRLADLICDIHTGIQSEIEDGTRAALYAAQDRIRELTGEVVEPLSLWAEPDGADAEGAQP
jgi:hypothetical protein